MTWFRADVASEAVVPAPRRDIWQVLTDPDRLADLVPRIDRIEELGDRWRWHLRGFSALGVSIAPAFTECMAFDAPSHIRYWHEPRGRAERAGAEGEYRLEEVDEGTRLAIAIEVAVDLPLPRATSGAVTRVMRHELTRMGEDFAQGLQNEVVADRAEA